MARQFYLQSPYSVGQLNCFARPARTVQESQAGPDTCPRAQTTGGTLNITNKLLRHQVRVEPDFGFIERVREGALRLPRVFVYRLRPCHAHSGSIVVCLDDPRMFGELPEPKIDFLPFSYKHTGHRMRCTAVELRIG